MTPTAAAHHPTRRPRPARRALAAGVGVAALLALAGCSSSGGGDAASPTTATRSTSTDAPGPSTTTTDVVPDDGPRAGCPDPDAVADVVGGPVDQTSSSGGEAGTLTFSYQGCGYHLRDGEGRVAVERLSSDLEGSELYTAVETATAEESDSSGFAHLPDLGDDAYRSGPELVVLHGPQVLFATYSPTGERDDADPDRALRVVTAVLPLDLSADPLDCTIIGAVLSDEFGDVIDASPGAGSTGVNDVTIAYEGCTIAFLDGGEATVDVGEATNWTQWVAAKRDSVFNVSFETTSVGELQAFDDGDQLYVDAGDQPLRITTEDLGLDDAEAAALRVSLAELALGGG